MGEGVDREPQAYTYAKLYLAAGYNVIPICDGEKRPAIKWQEYQSRMATHEEITRWFYDTGIENVAIVTGRISDLTVIDSDPRNGGGSILFNVPLGQADVVTGGGGYHWYYRWCGERYPCHGGAGMDIKGDGGYVLAPPSKTHGEYRFAIPGYGDTKAPERRPNEKIMQSVVSKVSMPKESHVRPSHLAPFTRITFPIGIEPGGRNNAATRFFGALLAKGMPPKQAAQIMYLWNSELRVPLPRAEIDAVIESISKKHFKCKG